MSSTMILIAIGDHDEVGGSYHMQTTVACNLTFCVYTPLRTNPNVENHYGD